MPQVSGLPIALFGNFPRPDNFFGNFPSALFGNFPRPDNFFGNFPRPDGHGSYSVINADDDILQMITCNILQNLKSWQAV